METRVDVSQYKGISAQPFHYLKSVPTQVLTAMLWTNVGFSTF